MRRTLIAVSAFFLTLACPGAGTAAWNAPAPVGNLQVATSNPSCATVQTGIVTDEIAVCAISNANHKLAVNRIISGTWIGWQVLAANITSDPSCASRGIRDVVCVARGLGPTLVYSIFNGTSWSAPAQVAGPVYSEPSCARLNSTKILCVVRNPSGTWSSAILTGTAWSAFTTVSGTQSVLPPSCASDGLGKAICAAVGIFTNVIVNRFNGSAWEGYLDLGGSASNQPVCVTTLAVQGGVRCMVRGNNMSAFSNRFKAGAWTLTNWTGYFAVGGTAQSTVTSAENASDVIYVVVGTDSGLHYNKNNTGWQPIGGAAIGNLSCTALTFDKIFCAVRDLRSRIVYTIGP